MEHAKVRWTKGHAADKGGTSWEARGNKIADEKAAKGREMHDIIEEEGNAVDDTFGLQGRYLRHVARSLAIWAAAEPGEID